MDLKQRLGHLRQQAGTRPDRPHTAGVAERVQRYRGRTRADATTGSEAQLATELGGALIDDGVILIEYQVPLSERHGCEALGQGLADVSALPEAQGVDLSQAVFLDTETSGLSGGTGTVVFLLGLARLDGERLVVRQYHLTRFSTESRLFALAAEWLQDAEHVVTFNGKTFDAPLLATRHRLCALHDPISRLRHLDLLHPTRRAFGSRWGDCRLATAERKLLGFEREDDIPGSMAPLAWFAWLQQGQTAGLRGIARHNYWDVLSLLALTPALAAVHNDPGAWDADVAAIARFYLARNQELQALTLLEQHRGMLAVDGLLALARLYRRRKQWAEARQIWESLAERGEQEALECLAKYHEHVARHYRRALDYAERLAILPEHEQRRMRLRRKLAANRNRFDAPTTP